jgi:probable F420-dependent oxidoreductase
MLRFGLFSMNTGSCSYPDSLVRIALAAEAAGFDSLWTPEHYVLPSTPYWTLRVDPTERQLDPLDTLAFLAAHTSRVMLGAGVIVLPHHNPIMLAKRVATLQTLSGNRFVLGIGVGHLVPEFEALGSPLPGRGRRADEYLEAMETLWFADEPRFDGRHVRFAGIQAYPRPERVPLVVGGRTPAAYRRAVKRADGFYGWLLDVDGARDALRHLSEAASQVERRPTLGPLEISLTPPPRWSASTVERYARLGVDRLIVAPERGADEAEILAMIERIGAELIPAFN